MRLWCLVCILVEKTKVWICEAFVLSMAMKHGPSTDPRKPNLVHFTHGTSSYSFLEKLGQIKWPMKISPCRMALVPFPQNSSLFEYDGRVIETRCQLIEFLTCSLLYSVLEKGTCQTGRPRLRFKDVIKRDLKDFVIEPGIWTIFVDRVPSED